MDAYKLDGIKFDNRIVGHDLVNPDDLLANPLNMRIHSKFQQDAIAGLLSEVGWVKSVIVNQRTGHIVDGHARVTLALRNGQPVPVEYIDIPENEEKLILASLDYMVELAHTDGHKLDALLRDVNTGDEHIQEMLAKMAADNGLYEVELSPPEEFKEYGEDIETEYRCPKCEYEWSGKPK